jgi:hypothetical protein
MLLVWKRQDDERRIGTFDLSRAVDEAKLNSPVIAGRGRNPVRKVHAVGKATAILSLAGSDRALNATTGRDDENNVVHGIARRLLACLTRVVSGFQDIANKCHRIRMPLGGAEMTCRICRCGLECLCRCGDSRCNSSNDTADKCENVMRCHRLNENELRYRWRERAWLAMDVFS